MFLIMLLLKDLPDAEVLRKFAARYRDVDADSVLQFLNILRVGTELSEALDRFLAGHGLLQGRWWVLLLLMREDNGRCAPSTLADKAGVTRPTMTGLVDGLERDGLVRRLDDPQDRRKYVVELTPAGQAKLDAVMPDYYRRVRKLMAAVPRAEREALVKGLWRLRSNAGVFG